MGACLKPTLAQLEAMARLRGNPDVAKLIEAVKDHEVELTERLIHVPEGAFGANQCQGAIKVLRLLRETLDSAPATIEKLKTGTR
jgi:hypothetical protein